jgi:hypothetical protein
VRCKHLNNLMLRADFFEYSVNIGAYISYKEIANG